MQTTMILYSLLNSVYLDVRIMLAQVKDPQLFFVYCECNGIAGMLSKLGSQCKTDCVPLDIYIPFRPSLLVWDMCPP